MGEFEADVGGHANVERLIQAQYYNEALRPPAEPTFPQFVGVPGRNRNFVGRERELAAIEPAEAGVATVIAQVATGMGGIGKTTLAIEHCHRHRPTTDVVRWLNAEDRQTLVTEYVRIAPAIGVDVVGLQIDDAIARVRSWFETTEHSWLLVLDNAETPDALDQLVPSGGNGRVLVTTRHQDWSRATVKVLRMGVLAPHEAVALLTTLTHRPRSPEAEALVAHLGHLALAVEQAAAFCHQTGWTFPAYQQHLVDRSRDLLARNPAGLHRPDGQDLTVLTVWDSSIERATAESEGARPILDVLAYLAPEHVPRTLLAADEPLLHNGDALFIDEALAALARYSLVDLHRSDPGEILTISVHRLVQQATRLSPATDACGTAIRLLRQAFPLGSTDHTAWPTCQVLEPHVLTATSHADLQNVELSNASWLLDRYATYLQYSGNPTAAPDVFEQAVDLHDRVAADDDAMLARRGNLALSYWEAGRIHEAIPLQEQVLADRERILGPDHPDTLPARNNLALSYRSAGRTNDAITLQERVLTDSERAFGPHHPDTLRARSNLAHSYSLVGRNEEASQLEEQVLADRERVLGPHHPDTLRSRSDLALSYWSAGRINDAITLQEPVLTDSERILGPHHPDTLVARANLAYSYWSARRRTEAVGLMEEAVAGSDRALGDEHPDTNARRLTLEQWRSEDRE